ncbi:MAG TPA: methyl-accepting chemotaxis protein [Quisquiliibacterium sp.]|nr:methyl-accepting chemotaxis protein [Quisquiliibacterium sp.]HQN10683.1 methyl-accepting chemotaxis protein [Quisquiliibacterium sp.]
MKLKAKFLLVPVAATVLICALGAASTVALRMEHDTLGDVHANGLVGGELQRARAQVAETNANVYRVVSLVGGYDENRVKSERAANRQRFGDTERILSEVAKMGSPEAARAVEEILPRLRKLARVTDEAIEMSIADVSMGAVTMQAAEGDFQVVLKKLADVGAALRAHSDAGFAESSVLIGRVQWGLGAASAAMALASLMLGLLIVGPILRSINASVAFAKGIAQGDLATPIDSDGSDEIAEMQRELGRMQRSLAGIVAGVRDTAEQIATASGQIAMGNADLSARTENQASSLQETTSGMEHLTQTVRSNADSARQANQLAMNASEVAQRGGTVVGEVVERMDAITDSSRKIADIIGVIDGIAFQTNILALNAAVEAARAGEQGRGFAVVAGEVRNLAQRSAEAAREIKGLITTSVSEVENGSKLVKDAGATMQEIVTSVKRVTDIIGEISAATGEQSGQIGQVGAAMGQLDQMTQQNAALVEESAAAAESLKEQARALTDAVSVFRVDGGARARSPWAEGMPADDDARPGRTHAESSEPARAAERDRPVELPSFQNTVMAAGAPVPATASAPAKAPASALASAAPKAPPPVKASGSAGTVSEPGAKAPASAAGTSTPAKAAAGTSAPGTVLPAASRPDTAATARTVRGSPASPARSSAAPSSAPSSVPSSVPSSAAPVSPAAAPVVTARPAVAKVPDDDDWETF